MIQDFMPRLLLIAGTGRNSGKTTFACQVLSRHSKDFPIIAIKISPHIHNIDHSGTILCNLPHLYIAQENNPSTHKDSSLMLKAGAHKSFFVVASENIIPDALQILKEYTTPQHFLICESGGLRKYIKPGVFLVFHNIKNIPKEDIEPLKRQSDKFITFNGNTLDFDVSNLLLSPAGWQLNLNNDNL